jgi:hypothetical protein
MKVVLMRWMKLTICFLENHINPESDLTLYHGRKIYEFALTTGSSRNEKLWTKAVLQ